MKKITLLFIICVALISLVGAAQPVQIIDSGCEVRSPQHTTIKLNEDITSHVHVINITAGSNTRLTNATTTCFAHMYNTTSHLLESNYSAESNGLEFYLDIDKGNFSTLGHFTFYIECVSPDSICAASGSLEITTNGVELTMEKSIMYMGLLAIMLLLFVVNVGVIPYVPKDDYDDAGTLISINQLKYLRPVLYVTAYLLLMSIVFIGSNIAIAYFEATLIGKLLFNIFYVMFALALPMVVLWFIYIFYSVFQDKEMKRYLERGIE